METKTVSLVVCKETTEVFEAAAKMIKEAMKLKKEGKSYLEIGAAVGISSVQDILKAIDGAANIAEELKSANLEETAGYGGALIVDAIRS
jgi:predicted O-methyltransferase YrrM